MGRLTLRLPETLHQQLIDLSENEGVSLNQYIVYALTAQVSSKYTVAIASTADREKQQQNFADLLERLGKADAIEINKILSTREQAEMEPELNEEIVNRLKMKIEKASKEK